MEGCGLGLAKRAPAERTVEGRRSNTKRNLGHEGWALDMQPGDQLIPEETSQAFRGREGNGVLRVKRPGLQSS